MKKEIFYTENVIEFIESLPQKLQEKLGAVIDTLEMDGRLSPPKGKKMVGHENLFEIRVKDSAGQYRVFYAYAKGDAIWLLHGFQKKTQKTPTREIQKALDIIKELKL